MKIKETTQLNKPLKAATTKLILGGVALLLLLSTLIYMTYAWYTKMVSVSGMKFDVAKWDFNANYAQTDFYVNVYKYSTLTEKKVAPGTSGYIPLELGAGQSDTDVKYAISIDRSTMSPEFKERIFFYYEEGNKKIYIGGAPGEEPSTDDATPIEGTIKKNSSTELEIYWEWIYEYVSPEGEESEAAESNALAWDEFDTKVGKNPELYEGDMTAKLSVVGVEVTHQQTN